MKMRLSKFSTQSKRHFIFILLFVFIAVGFAFYLNASSNNEKPKRVAYDFNKLNREVFLSFTNDAVGFSIKYPQDMEVYRYDPPEARIDMYNKLAYSRDMNLSLVSQLAEGTELFDGVSMDFYSYQNPNRLPLESVMPQKTQNEYPSEGDVVSRENMFINTIPVIKTFTCCWGGGTTNYYIATKEGAYILRIAVFVAGPDKEKFSALSTKILSSLELQQ